MHINASDVRTFKDLYETIERGQGQDIYFDGKKRPACLIIDEVDGAVAGGDERGFTGLMSRLEKLVLPKKDEFGSTEKNDKPKMRRPIIFIANNFFARSIKALRDVSIQVKITQADPERLLTRMRFIASQENLDVSNDLLNHIC